MSDKSYKLTLGCLFALVILLFVLLPDKLKAKSQESCVFMAKNAIDKDCLLKDEAEILKFQQNEQKLVYLIMSQSDDTFIAVKGDGICVSKYYEFLINHPGCSNDPEL